MTKSIRNAKIIVGKALERITNQTVAGEAYLCTMQLPSQFTDTQEANELYKKIQSDFCKSIYRNTGHTPRYVAVRTNSQKPAYAICLFTKLEQPEIYAEKGRMIANAKAVMAGWGNGEMDIVELVKDSPKFTIASKPIEFTAMNRGSALERMQQHLETRKDIEQPHQRTIFVSKCK